MTPDDQMIIDLDFGDPPPHKELPEMVYGFLELTSVPHHMEFYELGVTMCKEFFNPRIDEIELIEKLVRKWCENSV